MTVIIWTVITNPNPKPDTNPNPNRNSNPNKNPNFNPSCNAVLTVQISSGYRCNHCRVTNLVRETFRSCVQCIVSLLHGFKFVFLCFIILVFSVLSSLCVRDFVMPVV